MKERERERERKRKKDRYRERYKEREKKESYTMRCYVRKFNLNPSHGQTGTLNHTQVSFPSLQLPPA